MVGFDDIERIWGMMVQEGLCVCVCVCFTVMMIRLLLFN